MDDVVIVGGGVIGLTTAWELARRGRRVTVVDRQSMGKEASWAGAGMIPPGEIHFQSQQYRKIAQKSARLWPELSETLLELTGIDNQYHRCGAILFPQSGCTEAEWRSQQLEWRDQGCQITSVPAEFRQQISADFFSQEQAPYWLGEQAQVRNPRHLTALKAACVSAGVRLLEGVQVTGLAKQNQFLNGVQIEDEVIYASQILFTTGAWSAALAAELDWNIPVKPIRGQIVLLKTDGHLKTTLEQGKRYIVPRKDGRVLIGSTEENKDFLREPDSQITRKLIEFALQLCPAWENFEIESSWCGFRPGTPDQLPILGQLPNWENVFLATGHYRAGLSLSPVTALIMADLMCGLSAKIPLSDFDPARFAITLIDNN